MKSASTAAMAHAGMSQPWRSKIPGCGPGSWLRAGGAATGGSIGVLGRGTTAVLAGVLGRAEVGVLMACPQRRTASGQGGCSAPGRTLLGNDPAGAAVDTPSTPVLGESRASARRKGVPPRRADPADRPGGSAEP
jgi:hypothetical protein